MKTDTKTSLDQIAELKPGEREQLKEVAKRFPFKATPYYLSLINWDDPQDPLRRVVIPDVQEMMDYGGLDPSNESSNKVMPGVQRKYDDTVLVQVSPSCLQHCRYCFRKRIFINGDRPEVIEDIDGAIDYISEHPEIKNALLTGGDSFLAPVGKLEEIISKLREIDHVDAIRLGTRVPVVDPERVLEDTKLMDMLERYSQDDKKVYVMTHFMHPRELTELATRGTNHMQQKGLVVYSQAPMIEGVNDSVDVLVELFNELSARGVTPHYIFQCRPVEGNIAYAVPVETGYEIFEKAQDKVSGLGKKGRFAMSHSSGKIEVIGMDKGEEGLIFMKYARAKDPKDYGRVMIFEKNSGAMWFDDYKGLEVMPGSIRYKPNFAHNV